MQNIYQIELTNYCNLKCSYCPMTVSKRPKGYMEESVFLKTLEHISKTKQKIVILHNFGEPLLHPQLEHFVALAEKRGFIAGFSTNGHLLTESKFINLIRMGLRWMCVSIHDKKAAGIFIQMQSIAKKEGCILFARNIVDNSFHLGDGIITINSEKHDFAGTAPDKIYHDRPLNGHLNCDFIPKNYFVILYNGTITACCMDESGVTKRGNLDDMEKIKHENKYKLCSNCEGVRFYNGFIKEEKFLKTCKFIGSFSLCMRVITNRHVLFFVKTMITLKKMII